MNHLLYFIGLVALSSILYRIGGAYGYHTLFRDLGVPACVVSCLLLLNGWNWTIPVSFLLMYGAMTTYWKKGPKAYWYHWFFTGLAYAVSWLPYAIVTHNIISFVLYVIIISIGTCLWSEWHDNVVWEECGRGAIVTLFAPLLVGLDKIFLLLRGGQ